MGPNLYDWCSYKRESLETESHTQGKSCEDTKRMPFTRQGMPETTRYWERGMEGRFSFPALRRNKPCWHLEFGHSALRTVRQPILLFKLLSLWLYYSSPYKLILDHGTQPSDSMDWRPAFFVKSELEVKAESSHIYSSHSSRKDAISQNGQGQCCFSHRNQFRCILNTGPWVPQLTSLHFWYRTFEVTPDPRPPHECEHRTPKALLT